VPDEAARNAAHAGVDLLIPILKGWCTETGIEVCDDGIQVHGGMGFIEETGIAQHLRDARITTIYEGTTGIQANDLIGRKVLRDGGRSMQALLSQIDAVCEQLEAGDDAQLHAIGARLREGSKSLADSVRWILATGMQDLNAVLAGAVPFLHLCGVVCGGWQMARAALAAQRKLAAGDGDAASTAPRSRPRASSPTRICRARAGSPRRPCTPAPARWRSPKNSSDLGALP
jgi:hypothetical protein